MLNIQYSSHELRRPRPCARGCHQVLPLCVLENFKPKLFTTKLKNQRLYLSYLCTVSTLDGALSKILMPAPRAHKGGGTPRRL